MFIVTAKVKKAPPLTWNEYDLRLVVDDLPKGEELIYKKVKAHWGSDLYFAEKDGYVSFFAHNSKDERGYGGGVFEINVEGEGVKKIKGPWSSNSGAMEKAGFTPSVNVLWNEVGGYSNISGHLTKTKVEEILRDFNLPYRVVRHKRMSDTWIIGE